MHLGRDNFRVLFVILTFCYLVFGSPSAHTQIIESELEDELNQIDETVPPPAIAEEESTAPTPAPVIVEENMQEEDIQEDMLEEELASEEDPTEPPVLVESAKAEEEIFTPEKEQELVYPPGVTVERDVYTNAIENCDCEYTYLAPYKLRRGTWGFTFGLGYSAYSPEEYKPDFVVNETFDSYYGSGEGSLVDMTLGLKWNNFLGSITFELGGGYYTNQGVDEESNIVLYPARASATLALDTLFKEPYVVPYGTIGAYTVFYDETLASQSVNGNSEIGLFFAAGVGFQLNWLDEISAMTAFQETGLENTYLFLEARSFLPADDLADFSSPIQLGAGLKLEY